MSLTTGTRLGNHEIVSLLGMGGMGEVYRARDTKLNRDVAIKVLPEAFLSDPDRVARFEREAQVLAKLNHPNIASIYGFEESHGVRALVLELVEGSTLAAPLPLEEALTVARQIADAFEAAHEQGIVHRDLKPANVKVTPSGIVKVLDFGLAKLVDRRADIWAFGSVLFETLTGRKAFDPGESISDAIVSILTKEPDWRLLPANTPPQIRTLLTRCLQKDPQKRLPHIGVAKLEIDEALATSPAGHSAALRTGTSTSTGSRARPLPWAIAAAAALAAGTLLVLWAPWRMLPASPLQRLSIELGADASLVTLGGAAAILSPDGQTLAFVARKTDGAPQLYVRRLDQLEATLLSGTDSARDPFFSPDGRWIAFFDGTKLKKIAVTGGTVVPLSDGSLGGTWAEDGTIVFSPGFLGPLARVSSDGGIPAPITTLAEDELTHRWPQLLAGGMAVLYTASNTPVSVVSANLVVQSLPGGPRKIIQRGATYGRYLPSGLGSPKRADREGGHLLYVQGGTLFAAPFDLTGLELTGPAAPVLEGVATITSGNTSSTGGSQFALSDAGTLVYVPGRSVDQYAAPLVWTDRTGRTSPLRIAPAAWSGIHFSPDGRRLAMDINEGGNLDVFVYDWARDALSRLTSDPGDDLRPTWTPDGRRLVFISTRENATPSLYWQRADGTGEVQRLTQSKNPQYAGTTWHPSGKFLVFSEINPRTESDLMILPMEGDEATGWKLGELRAFLNSPANEWFPSFSPDGRWLAYLSNESGRYEVYVRPFPGPGSKEQVSTGGTSGNSKLSWSRTRNELLFATLDQHIMVVSYRVEGDSFRPDKPRLWSERAFLPRPNGGNFDLHPDSERVALAPVPETQPTAKQDHVVIITNFFDELRRLAPTKP